jgi:hypothetical protein
VKVDRELAFLYVCAVALIAILVGALIWGCMHEVALDNDGWFFLVTG